jgi:hemolysin activation/secretion protein
VRGYDFGTAHGDALWSAQFDISRPGKGTLKPVLFADAGQAGNRATFGSAQFLSGAGAGVSLLGGFMRAELSYPLTHREGRGVRFDLVFGGPR